MFEQAFKRIDTILRQDDGCSTELDYIEQTSWLLFLKYLDALEQDRAQIAALHSQPHTFLLEKRFRWDSWAMPLTPAGTLDHNKALIRAIELSIAPVGEQKRIVAILDKAFEGIATARANAEQNRQNARSLFATSLDRHLRSEGSRWKEMKLGEISEVQSGGTPLISTRSYWGGDIPWYSSGELNEFYTIAPKRYITRAGVEHSNAKVFPRGSLLMGMYDTAALKMSVLDRDAAFNQAIAGVKPNDSLDLFFLLHTINARKELLLSERRGTRQKNLSLAKIKDIRFKVPPISIQRKIVKSLQDDAATSEKLTSVYQKKLIALENLKQSLLHQAFTGKL